MVTSTVTKQGSLQSSTEACAVLGPGFQAGWGLPLRSATQACHRTLKKLLSLSKSDFIIYKMGVITQLIEIVMSRLPTNIKKC